MTSVLGPDFGQNHGGIHRLWKRERAARGYRDSSAIRLDSSVVCITAKEARGQGHARWAVPAHAAGSGEAHVHIWQQRLSSAPLAQVLCS